ncbi:MAG: DUF4364 family protein [Oscillospiraceae bacterium]|jgi:hypothetical protein|nr:DUF4364 family protein [Oscillospiraceae bacterium]
MNNRFGLVSDQLELKIFVMFMLRALAEPAEFEPLYSLAQRDGGVSYFDLVECLNSLRGTGHVAFEDGKYFLTARGAENIAITENNLPYSLRLRAEKSARARRAELSRGALISTSRTIRRTGGYTVGLSLSDGTDEIISMEVFAPAESDAIALENGFRERAEAAYNKILGFILDAP